MTDPMAEPAPNAEGGVKISRRQLVIGGTLAAASLGATAALPKPVYPQIDARRFAAWVPNDFGPWKFETASGVLLPTPDILATRLYDDLVTKTYIQRGKPNVMMLIAYNYRQDGIIQIHRPETCYTAGGYALTPTEGLQLDVGQGRQVPAAFFTGVGPQQTEQVLFWTRIGPRFPRSWVDQRLAVMASNLAGAIPDGAMIRFSIADTDRQGSLETLREFVVGFLDAADGRLRRLLLGDV